MRILLFHFVLIEMLFQLENWYKLMRREAAAKLTEVISFEWIEIADKPLVCEALILYQQTTIDFVDVLLYVFAKGNNYPILSFDKDYDKLNTKIRLEH